MKQSEIEEMIDESFRNLIDTMFKFPENPYNINFEEIFFKGKAELMHKIEDVLKEKNKEIEELQQILARNITERVTSSLKQTKKSKEDLEMLNKGYQIGLEKKDKEIDLILDKLNENYTDIFKNNEAKEIIGIYEEIKNTSNLSGIKLRKECIKQYFERKAEQC